MESCPSWSKEHDWKSCKPQTRLRGFESLALRHKSTVILIELRWAFSIPENRLESGFSAVSAHKRTPLRSNSAAGFCAFYVD